MNMNQVKVEKQEVEAFLIDEAYLINEGKYTDWLELFTEEAIYWVPSNKDNYDPNTHVSIIYDNRERLGERVWRLESGLAYGQEPKSRTRHLITNIKILDKDDKHLTVSSNFIIVELRRGIQTTYSGRFEHKLRIDGPSWKIASKKVELINNNEFLGNLSFIL
jgi:3-phenylpropionate/cinnamic acid dioxygenase small subunit